MAPPHNPRIVRKTIICPRLVALAHNTLLPVKPSAAATNSTRVDSSRDIIPLIGTITTSAIR
jgi:hypothetical protein